MPDAASALPPAQITLVAPALNEAGNLTPLLEQVDTAFREAGIAYHAIIVDDGSTDATASELACLGRRMTTLRTIRHEVPRGQSAALYSGIQAAVTPLVATLDADLQNDPADLPRMVALLHETRADLVQGDRSANRRDHAARRAATFVGRLARRIIVGDRVRDTGCATRVIRTALAQRLPLHRPGMHRFIPACAAGLGGKVVETPVNHRGRGVGKTKYGTGLIKRGLPGLRDCFAVRCMIRQARNAPEIARNTPGITRNIPESPRNLPPIDAAAPATVPAHP